MTPTRNFLLSLLFCSAAVIASADAPTTETPSPAAARGNRESGLVRVAQRGDADAPDAPTTEAPLPTAARGVTPEAVQRAIDEGTRFLIDRQQPDGGWEEDAYRQYAPGTTSLCLLALLSSGMTAADAPVSRGLRYVEQFTPDMQQRQTYPIALQTMVFCQADPEKYFARIEENAEALLHGQFRTDNPYSGGWSYSDLRQNFSYAAADNSNSQFAVLALYEAQKAGVEIPAEAWREIEEYWTRLQNKDGSWGYRASYDRKGGRLSARNASGTGTGSMTCAGIVALWVSDALRVSGVSVSNGRIRCCDGDARPRNRERIEKGFDWLAEHFSVRSNPGSGAYLYYYLYGLERTGRLTARRFFGGADWYREGADYLLGIKNELSRSWKAGASGETLDVVATSFALLFLSKGRWPVLVSKLRYDAQERPAEWNCHPDDLDHLTRHVEKAWGRSLTWQVIDASRAVAEDYRQTPVLSISGRVSPLPDDPAARRALVENLRAYLEEGGFILAEALDGDESFESGFRELAALILEGGEGEGLQLLPEDHPIWTIEAKVDPEYIRPIYGADLGCRTNVVLIPAASDGGGTVSLSCLWELADPLRRGPEYSESVEARIDAALAIGQNILAYATGRELKNKDETAEEAARRAGEKGERRGDFYAAILTLGRGSSCAPRAIPRLMEKINETIPVQTVVRKVRPEADQLGGAPLLFFHGRQAFSLSADQTAALHDYFSWGGFLFANAVCGSRAFADSFAAEMKKVFPDARLEPIPADDPLFSSLYGGKEIKTLAVRRPRAGRRGWEEKSEPPRLYGIKQDGRWVVVFSPFDVSCALEARSQSACPGYTPESAYNLSVNVVLYAMEHL
ncbi:MAG: DUF4159 domain-containing protein [Thermoguttaceae bacterium]|nr:DUF4159 domain-containing protein [Thermoguttaceae bacterium]